MIYVFLLSLATEWITDTNTGKEYSLLEMSTATLDHDINHQKCRDIGGHLPEPKDAAENAFLDVYSPHRFLLGIQRNVANQRVYDSDQSNITWVSWANWQQHRGPFPWEDNNWHWDCVSTVRNRGIEYTGHRTQDWANNDCASNAYIQSHPKSLICQKSG